MGPRRLRQRAQTLQGIRDGASYGRRKSDRDWRGGPRSPESGNSKGAARGARRNARKAAARDSEGGDMSSFDADGFATKERGRTGEIQIIFSAGGSSMPSPRLGSN